MYSMVLMMAMASGPDTAAFGGHRNSYCGAQAVSYGCNGGSSCHGGRGGHFLGNRHSCNGGGSSCHGGGGGGLFHRNRGGCTGTTAAACCPAPAPACCGTAVVPAPGAPPATMPAPTPMGDKKGS